jgi:hypothetical protein
MIAARTWRRVELLTPSPRAMRDGVLSLADPAEPTLEPSGGGVAPKARRPST